MDWTSIITSLIVAGIPACVTLITSSNSKKESQKQAMRSNILSLITIDKMNVMEGKLPENRQLIHDEYDKYRSQPYNGNSWLHQKVEEYDNWCDTLIVKKGAKK